MVSVPEVFFENPRPLALRVEPAGPVFGLEESVVALDVADALGAVAIPVDPAITVSSATKPAPADRM